MIERILRTKLLVACLFLVSCSHYAVGGPPKFDTAKIEQITGWKGSFNEQEEVFKISSPRTDVKVSVDAWQMAPFMGLTPWAAFLGDGKDKLMVMGDLVLFQDEVNPVMSAALENGLDVTALHNHFFFDDPKVYFMHIGGAGSLEALATGVRKATDKVKEIRALNPTPAKSFGGALIPPKSSVTAKPLDDIFGIKGQTKDGMFKAVFGRKVKMACGCELGKDMGVNTWAAFAGADDNAVVDGDFAIIEEELQPVLKSLRRANINIVAIHHHMALEKPRVLFLHYWGKGKAEELAKSLKAALDLLEPTEP